MLPTNAFLNHFLDARWLQDGARAAQTVCYIGTPTQEGTGFLVGPDLVLTAYHVVTAEIQAYNQDQPAAPANVEIRFGYQVDTNGAGDQVIRRGTNHPLTTAWLVDCSPVSDRGFEKVPWLRDFNPVSGLDYALLRLADAPGHEALGQSPRGWLRPPWGTVHLNDPLFILQHPRLPATEASAPLKVVLLDQAVSLIDATHIKYMTNTAIGASGSPCFTRDWELVALHHRADLDPTHPTGREGIRIDVIMDQPKVQAAVRS